jgi:hypothetical protein
MSARQATASLAEIIAQVPTVTPVDLLGDKSTEAGSIEPDDVMLKRLADMAPSSIEYEREKVLASKRLGISAAAVDRLVRVLRPAPATPADTGGKGSALKLNPPTAWGDPVDGASLLDEIKAILEAHLALPPHASVGLPLWIAHTYAFEQFSHTPRLAILSPEPRCGKSTLLALLQALCCKPLSAANITAAAMFRTIELAKPTLLIDEADTFISDNEELRGVVNSGHASTGGVVRTVGDDHEPRLFSTFAPAAIAGIGRLPATITDRSVIITMRRKLATEAVQRLKATATEYQRLPGQLARFIEDVGHRLAAAEPELPETLNDRQADGWRALLAIADAAGGHWPTMAREAAVGLCATPEAEAESKGAMLLEDIRSALGRLGDEIASADLCAALAELEDRPWPEWKAGKPMTPKQLASMLSRFGIRPGTIRPSKDKGQTVKGYSAGQFVDAFGRYLSPIRHTVTSQGIRGFQGNSDPSHDNGCDGSLFPANPQESAGCDGVTDQNPLTGPNRDLSAPEVDF